MFEFVRNSKIVKFIMVLICASFLYFGFQGLSLAPNQYIVEIGDTRISNYDVKNYLSRMQQSISMENIDNAYAVLQKRVYLIEGGRELGVEVSPKQISQMTTAEPFFRDISTGRFSNEKFEEFLSKTGRTKALYKNELKKDFYFNVVNSYLKGNHVLSDYQIQQSLLWNEMQKEIQLTVVSINEFKKQIKPDEASLQKFYAEHQQAYKLDQAVKYEYLVLTPEWVAQQQKVTEAEIKEYYENNKLTEPKRLASHILIAFPNNTALNDDIKSTLKKQAEDILAQVKRDPKKFIQLAETYSQDSATAKSGGSLGFIEKNGQWVLPLEEGAFKLSTGEISDIIETEFGYHILKVDAALDWKDLTADRVGITYVLQLNKAKKEIGDLKEKLAEESFNEPKELSLVSKKVFGEDLVKKHTTWLSKQEAQLANIPTELINALFDAELMNSKNNSDLINIGNVSWVIRVSEVRAEKIPDYTEVAKQVSEDYKVLKAGELAKNYAKELLQKLNAGESLTLDWGNRLTLTLQQADSYFNQSEFRQFLEANPGQNQVSYYLLEQRSQPTLVRVNAVRLNSDISEAKIKDAYLFSNDILSLKNEVAFLTYLQRKVSRKVGDIKLER